MSRRLTRPIVAFALLVGGLAAAATVARAADPPAEETQETAKKPEPPRRFTDDDLKDKYHRAPKPPAAPDEEEAAPAPAAPAAAAPGAKPPASPAAKPVVAPAGKTPASPGASPVAGAASTKPPARPEASPAKKVLYSPKEPPDPLQGYRDAAAKDATRERELKARRERIAALETRLNYLQTKRNALVNPGSSAVGNTGPVVRDYDERTGKPAMIENSTGKPPENPMTCEANPSKCRLSTTPDISPGRITAPVSPMFPPLPTAQTDEDRENDRRMKVKDLLAAVEKEIPVVEDDLDRARRDLVDYETRFAIGAVAP